MLRSCLLDIQVIQRRLNNDCAALEARINSWDEKIGEYEKQIAQEEKVKNTETGLGRLYRRFEPQSELRNATSKKAEDSAKLQSIINSKFGVILNPELAELKDKCLSELANVDVGPKKLPVYFGDTSGINIGDIEVKFKRPEL